MSCIHNRIVYLYPPNCHTTITRTNQYSTCWLCLAWLVRDGRRCHLAQLMKTHSEAKNKTIRPMKIYKTIHDAYRVSQCSSGTLDPR
jgi:hypothetical protein